MDISSFVKRFYLNFKLKDFCISLFTINDFPEYPISNGHLSIDGETIKQYDELYYAGKIFKHKGNFYFISEIDKSGDCLVESLEPPKKDYYINKSDEIVLDNSIPNVKQKIKTTYGKLLLNSTLLIDPFGSIIPYMNDSPMDVKKLKQKIIDGVLKEEIEPDMIYKFFTNFDFLSSLCQLFVSSISKNLLVLHPDIIKRKKELLDLNKDKLDDPVTMVKIEDELIKMDKDANAHDESIGFTTNKSFDVHRKRMFSNFGMIEPFGGDEFHFAKSNLDDGWEKDDLPLLFNEIRKGVYGRGIDTAKGGAITNDISRIFQDTLITQNDCKTKRGIPFKVTKDNKNQLENRYIIDNDKTVLITDENISKYLNKTVTLRSPMTCAVKDGNFCYKCCDHLWKIKDIKLLNVIPVKISSTIMLLSMKSMHGTKTSFYQINNLDNFLF